MQENDEIEAANEANYLVLLLFSEFINQFYSVVVITIFAKYLHVQSPSGGHMVSVAVGVLQSHR